MIENEADAHPVYAWARLKKRFCHDTSGIQDELH